jgi:hypothetical protein
MAVMVAMENEENTSFDKKCEILADLWLNFKNDEEFLDFFEYNDLGLPLAYAVANGIVETTDMAARFIEETFALLLDALEAEDIGFESIDDLLALDE